MPRADGDRAAATRPGAIEALERKDRVSQLGPKVFCAALDVRFGRAPPGPNWRKVGDPVVEDLEHLLRGSALAEPLPELGAELEELQEDRKAVEAYSVAVAIAAMAARFPGSEVRPLPHNTPGHDAVVRSGGRVIRYVEVKGTRSRVPTFFLSEGERAFSATYGNDYTLVVVWEIDLVAKTHQVGVHDGPIDRAAFQLRETDWVGIFPTS